MKQESLIPSVWEIPQKIRLRLGSHAGQQRVIFEEGHMLIVLHKPANPDQADREAALFWRKPDGGWLSDQQGSGIASLSEHIDSYVDAIDRCEQDEMVANSADAYFSVLDRISPLHRSGTHMHQVLQEARTLCKDDLQLINKRDRAYDVSRRAELLYNGTKNSLDFAVAKRVEEQTVASHRMAVAAHRLNLLAAFFFPIATVASILGVNLTFPYRDDPSLMPFVVVVAACLLFGFALAVSIFSPNRKPR